MRFSCEQCNAQYMIADEKVGQKGVRVRCKKCGYIITVRPGSEADAADLPGAEHDHEAGLEERDSTDVMRPATDPEFPSEGTGPDATTVDRPEGPEAGEEAGEEAGDGGVPEQAGFEVGEDELGNAFDNLLEEQNGGADQDEDAEDEDRPDFDRQATRVFNAEEMLKVQEEKDQAAQDREEISNLYHSAQASVAEEEGAPAGTASTGGTTGPTDEEMERVEWYAAVDEQQVGPMSMIEMGERWSQGEFDPETLVWKTGFDDWIPIYEVDELRHLMGEEKGEEPVPAEEESAWDGQDAQAEGGADELGDSLGLSDEGEAESGEYSGEYSDESNAYGDDSEGLYDDDAPSAASEAAFAGADVDWKPSAISNLDVLAEEELASLKPPPEPEVEDEAPFGLEGELPEEEEVGSGEMEEGDSSIIGQIAAEEEAAARRAEQERQEQERQAEEARKKEEEAALVAQEAARREREEEVREKAAAPPDKVIPSPAGTPKWVVPTFAAFGVVVIALVGIVAYMAGTKSSQEETADAPSGEVSTAAMPGTDMQPMVPPKGPATTPATSPAKPGEEATPDQPGEGVKEPEKVAVAMPVPEKKDTPADVRPGPVKKPVVGPKKRKRRKPATAEPRVAKHEPPPPPEEPPPRDEPKPKRKGPKGGILDFEDEKAFADVTGSEPAPKKVVEVVDKPAKKELPPLSDSDVLGVMRKHLAEFKACNRKQKEIDPSVRGKMVVPFIINPNGRVSSVAVGTPQFKNTFVAGCIVKVIRQLNFPQFGGKPKKVNFPFSVK